MRFVLRQIASALVMFVVVSGSPLLHLHDDHDHSGWLSSAHAAEKYTCGMHPMIVVDEPGLCPICGMDLTPLNESGGSGSAGGASTISIDPVTVQNMGVRTERAVRRELQRTIKTVGIVDYMEPKQYSVNTKISGWIERLYVDETGQHVRKGEPLLDIYSPELVSAQEEYLLALDNFKSVESSPFPEVVDGARRLLQASRSRLEFWDISDRQIRQLEKNGKASRTLTIHASYKGIVTRKSVESGMFVNSGMELFKISDISKVWVNADIYESELPWVRIGQQAEIILPFVGNKVVQGTISYIYPYVEPKTRTVKARIELDNRNLELKPEMFVNIRIQADAVADALSIPAEAVLYSGENQTVFVALDEGRFEPRRVRTGVQNEQGYIAISEGLSEGDVVVTSAQFMLDSESKLKEAIQKMMSPSGGQSPEEADLNDLFE